MLIGGELVMGERVRIFDDAVIGASVPAREGRRF